MLNDIDCSFRQQRKRSTPHIGELLYRTIAPKFHFIINYFAYCRYKVRGAISNKTWSALLFCSQSTTGFNFDTCASTLMDRFAAGGWWSGFLVVVSRSSFSIDFFQLSGLKLLLLSETVVRRPRRSPPVLHCVPCGTGWEVQTTE